jgi:hypothetical protein
MGEIGEWAKVTAIDYTTALRANRDRLTGGLNNIAIHSRQHADMKKIIQQL